MCCCMPSDACHDEPTTASEERAAAGREPQSLETRIAQLEIELRELRSED